MPAVNHQNADPSPSRMKYRLERVWLTPLYRSMIRTGIPVAIVLILILNYFASPETRMKVAQSYLNARNMIEERPEFAVALMRIQGASTDVATEVREAVPMAFPVSSMRLDLAELKIKIEKVAAVKEAALFLRNGVLEVQIDERVPALIWRGEGRFELVDGTGARAGLVESRAARDDLPLIIGIGAQKYAGEALQIIKAVGPLAPRVRALRRMGQRRWDVMLDRDQIIKLPAENPVQALQRVIALSSASDVLGRDVTVVDMRDGRRPVLRLSAAAVEELHRLRAIADGDET